jgi:hypothetical protein
MSDDVVAAPRAQRLWQATLQRNLQRPLINKEIFRNDLIPDRERDAWRFIITQLWHIEAVSPQNLSRVARAVPLDDVRACMATQILDEIAHGRMLMDWLQLSGGATAVHPAARLSPWLGEFVQRDPWLGIAHVTLFIEYYASVFLDVLQQRAKEPHLVETLAHIQKDESRHKAIAVEAIVSLRRAGYDRRLIVKLSSPMIDRSTLLMFRTVFGRFVGRHAAALDLNTDEVLTRALDEAHSAIQRTGALP